MSALIDKALKAKRESKWLDFKRSFNPNEAGEWCEIIKDIIAMANSGGGAIVIGIANDGSPSGEDITAVLQIDHAMFVDKIRKYTDCEFGELEVSEARRQEAAVAIIEVAAVKVPIVFTEVGTYEVRLADGKVKQKTAFSKGTVYFRHGSKSEPGSTEDLRNVIDRRLEAIRSEWLDNVQKVVKAPQGATVQVVTGEVRETRLPDATPIRLVNDPDAPGYRIIDYDTTYPHRRTELINVVNGMLPSGVSINTYDITAVRHMYEIDDDARYCRTLKFGSPQYSDQFAQWLVDQHKANNTFFVDAREHYYDVMHGEEL